MDKFWFFKAKRKHFYLTERTLSLSPTHTNQCSLPPSCSLPLCTSVDFLGIPTQIAKAEGEYDDHYLNLMAPHINRTHFLPRLAHSPSHTPTHPHTHSLSFFYCRLLQNSNSDHWSKRQGRWPLMHTHSYRAELALSLPPTRPFP